MSANDTESDFDGENLPGHGVNAPEGFKRADQWFNFEGRCLVCAERLSRPDRFDGAITGAEHRHLGTHVKEGVLVRKGAAYQQVKAHPVGFPGILLPMEMEWTK